MPKKKKNIVEINNDEDKFKLETDEESITTYSSSSEKAISPEFDGIGSTENLLQLAEEMCNNLLETNTSLRLTTLKKIYHLFQTSVISLDNNWKCLETLYDTLEKILKKGKLEEQILAAKVLKLYLIQLDNEVIIPWQTRLQEAFEVIFRNSSISSMLRIEAIQNVALFCIWSDSELFEIRKYMDYFESIFKGSYLKGDGSHPILQSDQISLHFACLESWTFLFTLLSKDVLLEVVTPILPKLHQLLKSKSVDLRIYAGYCLVVLYERIRAELNPRFKGNAFHEMVEQLEDLSKDGAKYRSKTERKKQRHSFRDFLSAIQSEYIVFPSVTIQINKFEVLEINSWVKKIQYDQFNKILGTGIIQHLKENVRLREVFNLGLPFENDRILSVKVSHKQKHLANLANAKILKQGRQLNRTKRMNAHEFFD